MHLSSTENDLSMLQFNKDHTGGHACSELHNSSKTFPLLHHTFICYITIVRDAEGHALSAPLLPEGDQSGLRDLSDNGGQMLLVAPIVAWRRGLGVSICTITAGDHRLTLGERKCSFFLHFLGKQYTNKRTKINSVLTFPFCLLNL